MILAAGLFVLLGLVLFVGGVLTGTTALYWGCVAVCALAALLLFVARREMGPPGPTETAEEPAEPAAEPAEPAAEPAAEAGRSAGEAPVAAGHPAAPTLAHREEPAVPRGDPRDPGVEEVEVTDLLLIVDRTDEVLVVDEHPRYHVGGCSWLRGRPTVPVPLDQARTDGFTPCAVCAPDRTLAEQVRVRKAAGSD